jgi:cyclic pyranopterin phosphate synthase
MRDKLGREIEYLRISVTQNCNLRCLYCVPEANECIENYIKELTLQEINTLVKVMAQLGIKKVRITGGEPLLRPDICDIIKIVSNIPEIKDLSVTTNGILLPKYAESLKAAGLTRVNISLDSLKPDKFKYITRGGDIHKVLSGINKALELGITPVKINVVLVKGINDDEINDFIQLTKDNDLDIRFIELMPIGIWGEENSNKIIYNSDIIKSHPELIKCSESEHSDVALYYNLKGYKGKIGFISAMSHKFCNCCNRIRLTYDGKIKSCLGSNEETNIIKVLRNKPEDLKALLEKTIYEKPEGHCFHTGYSSNREMNKIGG